MTTFHEESENLHRALRELGAAIAAVVTHRVALGSLAETSVGVTMWRCADCGKWSHAKLCPKSHLRFIPDENAVVEHQHDGAAWRVDGLPVKAEASDGWWVHCGPFDEWRARRTL